MSLALPDFSLRTGAPLWEIKPVAVASLPVPAWECVFGKNDCTMQEIVFWVWILRQGETIAIIDTGLPVGSDLDALNQTNQQLDSASIFTVYRSLDDVLTDEGISPESVQYALLSQLITYSTGGISQRTLPNASIYCAWGGMHELLTRKPGHPPRNFYLTPQSWNYFRELLVEDRLAFAEESLEVAPGLVYDPTGGHHPGSAGIRVKTRGGVVGILETAFVQENIEKEVPIGIAENASECREIIRKYRKNCDLTVAGHTPDAPQLLAGFLERERKEQKP